MSAVAGSTCGISSALSAEQLLRAFLLPFFGVRVNYLDRGRDESLIGVAAVLIDSQEWSRRRRSSAESSL